MNDFMEMVDSVANELLKVSQARMDRLVQAARNNGASDATIDSGTECLLNALERLSHVYDEVKQAEADLDAVQDSNDSEEVAFLQKYGIDLSSRPQDDADADAENTKEKEGEFKKPENPRNRNKKKGNPKEDSKQTSSSAASKNVRDSVRSRSNSLTEGFIPLPLISQEEFSQITPTTRGRLDLGSLNEMVEALNKAICNKLALIKRPQHQLRQDERELVFEWKSQSSIDGLENRVFIKDSEFRSHLLSKLRLSWNKCGIPCLRALKMICEIRSKGSLYIVPMRK
ncbi:unnamed protein product [Anisakis simplex]|uniref:SKA complex subunit 1 n=1 Tax=Anisakis simplex TaxID=6269 RepID=A0A0M3K084_ANISI|nr:unnamed protein product [Anisakis simplex]